MPHCTVGAAVFHPGRRVWGEAHKQTVGGTGHPSVNWVHPAPPSFRRDGVFNMSRLRSWGRLHAVMVARIVTHSLQALNRRHSERERERGSPVWRIYEIRYFVLLAGWSASGCCSFVSRDARRRHSTQCLQCWGHGNDDGQSSRCS